MNADERRLRNTRILGLRLSAFIGGFIVLSGFLQILSVLVAIVLQLGGNRIGARILQATRWPPLTAGSNFHFFTASSAGFSKALSLDLSTRGLETRPSGLTTNSTE